MALFRRILPLKLAETQVSIDYNQLTLTKKKTGSCTMVLLNAELGVLIHFAVNSTNV